MEVHHLIVGIRDRTIWNLCGFIQIKLLGRREFSDWLKLQPERPHAPVYLFIVLIDAQISLPAICKNAARTRQVIRR